MISDKYKCIFIHIPKNAGTSIESKICSEEGTENLLPDHRTILDFEPLSPEKLLMLYKKDQIYSAARRAKYFFRKRELGSFYKRTSALTYRKYFKFTVVRNPWSRVYSWFRGVMRDVNEQIRYKVPEKCNFIDFIKCHLHSQPGLRTQFYWLCDSKGDIPMDFICRFENLKADFLKIAESIGLNNPVLPKKRYSSKSASYVEAFNDQTKDIVWKYYAKEIKYFGFEFGE